MTESSDNQWWVYILRCSDGTLYTGVTTDIEKRITAHNEGKGAKYTLARRPVSLEYREPQLCRSDAAKRESEIKRLSRSEKEALIEDGG